MADKRTTTHPHVGSGEFPLDQRTWDAVVRTLKLAPQQARIVEGLLLGMSDKQIAAAIGISVPTLRTYLGRVFQRLGIGDRLELVVRVFVVAREVERGG